MSQKVQDKNYTQEQFGKLPNWAKDTIRNLEGSLEEKKKLIATFNGSNTRENSLIEISYLLSKTPLYLGDYLSLNVKFQKEDRWGLSIRHKMEGDKPMIHISNGSGSLIVLPQASNSIYLKNGKY